MAVNHKETDALVRQQLPGVVTGDFAHTVPAADVAIVKSGTATLETAMVGVPMIVFYRLSPFAYWLGNRRTFSLPFFSLPNILAGQFLVPELIQDNFTAARLRQETAMLLADKARQQQMRKTFGQQKRSLKQGAQDTVEAAIRLLPC